MCKSQSPHSLSALIQAHQQLLKTSVERQMSRYNGRIFMMDVVRLTSVFQMDGTAVDEV